MDEIVQEIIRKGYTDSTWVEHRQEIENFVKIICSSDRPTTNKGRMLLKNTSGNHFFQYYSRLIPIFGSLLSLIELNQVDKMDGHGFFASPENQKMAIRAMGFVVEDAVKKPIKGEKVGYNGYIEFFKKHSAGSRVIDSRIETGNRYNDIVDALSVNFLSSILEGIPGCKSFNIDLESLSQGIRRDLSSMEKEVREKIISPLINKI